MATYIIIGSFLLFCVVVTAWKKWKNSSKQQDSMLRQRAIFNLNQQLTYTRLKEILPEHTILAHVSYDALLTTKFFRTRNKYRNLIADFVVLDQNHQVVAIVAVDDPMILKRPQQAQYEDALLNMAGYQVIRYEDIPEYSQLRRDFLNEPAEAEKDVSRMPALKKYPVYSHLDRSKLKAMG